MTATLARKTATRFALASYAAFKVSDLGRTYPVQMHCEPESLRDALNAAVVNCAHKETLLIRETDEAGVRLHLYAIKRRSAPDYVRTGHEVERVHRLYAEAICVIDGAVLS